MYMNLWKETRGYGIKFSFEIVSHATEFMLIA